MEISEVQLSAIQKVAAAMKMTVSEFLTEEVRGISPEQAREYLSAFVGSADDSKIMTAYYLVKATTNPSKKPPLFGVALKSKVAVTIFL